MNNSIIVMPFLPTCMITDIFDFAMMNLFAFAMMYEPYEIFNHFSYFNSHVDFNCLFGRCGDRLLIVCY